MSLLLAAVVGCAEVGVLDPMQHEVTYVDVTGEDRTVKLYMHLPSGEGPAPVVVWTHGGALGHENPKISGADWAELFVSDGYVVVTLAHDNRGPFETGPLCVAIGEPDCLTFKPLTWDRPMDMRAVVDWLEDLDGDLQPIADRMDLTRLVFGGHSSGGGGVLTSAGAQRSYGGVLTDVSDPRPIAVIAASPQGPYEDRFVPESFETVNRPVLAISGEGDDVRETHSEARRATYDLLGTRERWLVWAPEDLLVHTSFNLSTIGCVDRQQQLPNGDVGRCRQDLKWIELTALTFLAAYTRDDAAAMAWLNDNDLEAQSSGALTLTHP